MERVPKAQPFWLSGLFLVVGAYLVGWVAFAGVREWFAVTLLIAWVVFFVIAIGAELRGRTRFAWGLPLMLFLVPWVIVALQAVSLLFRSGGQQ